MSADLRAAVARLFPDPDFDVLDDNFLRVGLRFARAAPAATPAARRAFLDAARGAARIRGCSLVEALVMGVNSLCRGHGIEDVIKGLSDGDAP